MAIRKKFSAIGILFLPVLVLLLAHLVITTALAHVSYTLTAHEGTFPSPSFSFIMLIPITTISMMGVYLSILLWKKYQG